MLSLAARTAYGAARGELRGPGHGGVVDLGGGHQPVDQPDRQRLVGLHEPAGEDDVLGLARADQPREPLGAAGAGDDAEQHLGLAERRVVGGDPDSRRPARARSRRRARSR